MVLKYKFEFMELDDHIVAVPVGDNSQELSGILKINDTTKRILEMLVDNITFDDLVQRLRVEYDADEAVISDAVRRIIEQLEQQQIIEL